MDELGRLIEPILGNGAVYRFAYDEMDRLARDRPDRREQRYRYDAAGQLIERTEVNRQGSDGQPLATRYDYDAGGRPAARHLPVNEHAPASAEQYQWGVYGQLRSVTNDHGEVTSLTTTPSGWSASSSAKPPSRTAAAGSSTHPHRRRRPASEPVRRATRAQLAHLRQRPPARAERPGAEPGNRSGAGRPAMEGQVLALQR